MKLKSLLLATVFSFALTSFAMAESVVDLFLQGVNSYNKGNYKQAANFMNEPVKAILQMLVLISVSYME